MNTQSIDKAVEQFRSSFKMQDLAEVLRTHSATEKECAKRDYKYTRNRGAEIICWSEKTQDRVEPSWLNWEWTKKELVDAYRSMLEQNPEDNPADLCLLVEQGLDGSDMPFNEYHDDYDPGIAHWCVRLDINGIDSDLNS